MLRSDLRTARAAGTTWKTASQIKVFTGMTRSDSTQRSIPTFCSNRDGRKSTQKSTKSPVSCEGVAGASGERKPMLIMPKNTAYESSPCKVAIIMRSEPRLTDAA